MIGYGSCGGGIGGCSTGARAHGLGDDFELVGARLVVLLLVLDTAVVLEEELAGFLQHPAALTDGTVGHEQKSIVTLNIYFSWKQNMNM